VINRYDRKDDEEKGARMRERQHTDRIGDEDVRAGQARGRRGSPKRKALAVAAVGACLAGAYASGQLAAGAVVAALSEQQFPGSRDAAVREAGSLVDAGYRIALLKHDTSRAMDGVLGFSSSHVAGRESCGCPACCGEEPDNVRQAPDNPYPEETAPASAPYSGAAETSS
jgi:hypothetical protein